MKTLLWFRAQLCMSSEIKKGNSCVNGLGYTHGAPSCSNLFSFFHHTKNHLVFRKIYNTINLPSSIWITRNKISGKTIMIHQQVLYLVVSNSWLRNMTSAICYTHYLNSAFFFSSWCSWRLKTMFWTQNISEYKYDNSIAFILNLHWMCLNFVFDWKSSDTVN